MAGLPLAIFPGFTSYGVVSSQVREIATVFNAEALGALTDIPEENIAWANIGTRVTKMAVGSGKIPVRLTSMLGFEPFEGERKFHQVTLAANEVRVNPFNLNLEWPVQINESQIAELINFYGVSGIGSDVVSNGRALKADIVSSVIIGGMTNANLGMTAVANTLAQGGYASGLPLFSDGSTSGASKHFANPLDARSKTFANLFLNSGKLTDAGVFGNMLVNMSQVPHPSKQNMTMGLGVTDIIGPTNMRIPFMEMAVRTLSLQGSTNTTAATTNIYNNDSLARAAMQISAAGMGQIRYHIAPQLDAHPYIVAHPTAQMWLAVSQSNKGGAWCELGGPSPDFIPKVTLLGDGSEECLKTRKVRMLGDLDCGGAAGLPHFVQLYLETTP